MNIHHLEYFLEVVRQGSFSKAAGVLHLSQPSVSKAIRDLESELGVTLLHRTGRQIELTDAGQAVLSKAGQVVAHFQNLTAGLDDIVNLKKGRVRIGIPPITCSTIFPRVLGEFSRAFPSVQLQLFEFGSKKILAGIEDGSLDIGIVCNPPDPCDYAIYPFVEDPLRVIVHPGHRLTKKVSVTFSDLAEEPFVLYSQDFSLYDQIIDRCRMAGFMPRIIFETSQREFMTQMVAAKLGIALLPGGICECLDPASIVSLPFSANPILLQMAIICRQDRYLSFAARRWLEFTTTRFGLTPLSDRPHPAYEKECALHG